MKKIILIILIISWMILIFILSNQQAGDSTKLSDGLIEKTIGNLYKITHKNTDEEKIKEIKQKYSHITRKMAHFTIYMILGLLTGLLLKEYNLETKKIIIYGIIICMCYAISDEIHQRFIVGRSCELKDVIIDTSGSTLGLLLIKTRWKNRKSKD